MYTSIINFVYTTKLLCHNNYLIDKIIVSLGNVD